MCQHWGAGDPSESTQIRTGRGIWVRKLFWALLKPQRVRCSTFCGLDEQVGAGEKKCTRAPNTQPTIQTASALKTSQARLLGLTFKASYVLVPFFLSLNPGFPCRNFLSANTMLMLAHSRCSINISSLFFHTSFNMPPSPLLFHSAYAAPLAHNVQLIKISIL